ncbi:Hsp70 family protein [Luedemannella helvata]|uniref:Hsp70 family protein n=1 Tax=Luedemannella helvata TaxID=349315 RepID=A0ABP4WKP2_9ACTN
MTEPILVVDFGTSGTAAALVLGNQVRLVKEPASGQARWPSSVCLDGDGFVVGTVAERRKRSLPRRYVDGPRRAVDADASIWLGDREITGSEALVAYLVAIKGDAERFYGGQVDRLTLTVPAGYQVPDPRRERLIAIGEQAGFRDVELVTDAVCAVLDPETGPAVPDGALVLVCDLGSTWCVTLARRQGDEVIPLESETSAAGRELDAQLINGLRVEGQAWLEPLLRAEGDAGLRAYYEAVDFIRRLKHQLSDSVEVEDHLTPLAPPFRLNRGWLEAVADPGLRWVVTTCRALVARAGVSPDDIAGVILVGGAARMPAVAPLLHGALALPVRWPTEPELAVVRGAATWAMSAATRVVPAELPKWRVEPLAWEIPGGRARLLRWLVEEGEPYSAGACLAQIGTLDDRVFDLTAVHEGTLLDRRVRPGDTVEMTLVAAASKSSVALVDDPPAKMYELWAAGTWLVSPDGRTLVECAETTGEIRFHQIADGAVTAQFRPEVDAGRPHHGRAYVSPDGRLTLAAWDNDGRFSIWDVESGRSLSRFQDGGGPHKVLVNEALWRLTAEGQGKVSAGRYQRTVTTMWDLRTGARVEKLTDPDWQRRHPGFQERSVRDGFGVKVDSPDGRLRAIGDSGTVTLREATTDRELFRAVEAQVRAVRTAFSADGRYLIASWDFGERSRVDVWEI